MRLAAPLLTLLLTGCGSSLYDWGSYENSIYRMSRQSADYNPAAEIDRLTREVEATYVEGGKIPPGKLMHIGYLHSLNNDTATAVRFFEAEKKLYPEATVFVDGIIQRAQGR